MRTQVEILEQYTKDGLGLTSDGALSMLAVINLLEILIDIRDILSGHLSKPASGKEGKPS